MLNREQHEEALDRINEIWNAPLDSESGLERERLVRAVEFYEDEEFPEFRRAGGETRLFLLAGPSGVGKDAVLEQVRRIDPGVHVPVSATTRPPREGEEQGREYIFTAPEEFARMERSGEFLETAAVHGRSYGTLRARVEDALAAGKDVMLKIDVQGAASVREKMPEARGIFLMPENMGQIEARLRDRGLEPAEVATRMDNAHKEMIRGYREFERVIVNREGMLDRTVQEVLRAMRERSRRLA